MRAGLVKVESVASDNEPECTVSSCRAYDFDVRRLYGSDGLTRSGLVNVESVLSDAASDKKVMSSRRDDGVEGVPR